MMLRPELVTAPAARLISTAEAKAHLRVDYSDDDAYIDALVLAVEAYIDGWSGVLGRALVTQTWTQTGRHFRHRMRLAVGPVQSVTLITYYDGTDTQQTVSAGVYRLHTDALGPYVVERDGQSWPGVTMSRDDAVTITYVAGHGDAASDVPMAIRQAALMILGHWYEHREAVTMAGTPREVPMAAAAMLAPWRRHA
jgi:uncharacterized phiE125 gp8 family phage protein